MDLRSTSKTLKDFFSILDQHQITTRGVLSSQPPSFQSAFVNYIEDMGSPPFGSIGHGPAHSGSVPEILPPGAGSTSGYGAPRPPARRPRRSWQSAPATYILFGINCAVFIGMTLRGISPIRPDTGSLLRWGADNAGAVLYQGEWWRIVTAMFVHGGILHLALNMWCLWNLGLLAEPLMGTLGVFAVYLLTGAAGNLLSTFYNWGMYHSPDSPAGLLGPVGVGASGAIFGFAGALIVLLKSPRLPVPPAELKKLRRSVIYFAVINLVIGFSIQVGTSVMNGASLAHGDYPSQN